MTYAIICALSKNNVIGQGLDIPWHLPNDFKYFKKITDAYPIVMGRNTWVSLPKKPLPNRLNVIISTKLNQSDFSDNVLILSSIQDMYNYFEKNKYDKVFIIGGGSIYKQTIDYVTELYLTYVDVELDVNEDTIIFPKFNETKYNLIYSEHNIKDNKHQYDYTYKLFSLI